MKALKKILPLRLRLRLVGKRGFIKMIISIKDTLKLFGISIIACCAVFVCTLFLNYNFDLIPLRNLIINNDSLIIYNAQVATGKLVSVVTGLCLVATSIIMLLFYIKNYIDTHGKELGILKALGYSKISIAKHFWIFGLSELLGGIVGFALSFAFMPIFYQAQNADKLLPKTSIHFHPILILYLIVLPCVLFGLISVLYAFIKLKSSPLNLMKEMPSTKPKKIKTTKVKNNKNKESSFLKDLFISVMKDKFIYIFLIIFSTFCFSAMTQMAFSMTKLASEVFSYIMVTIGLILSISILYLSISSIVKRNSKTISMMKVFGYSYTQCSNSILGCFRPFAYLGFIIGTFYQYGLLKIVTTQIFANYPNMPNYHFDFVALAISFASFIVFYELFMLLYTLKLRKQSIKSIMME